MKNPEIVFYDVETTIPAVDMIEFGAIRLDKTGLYERETYSTLIYSSRVDQKSVECNGITPKMLKDAPAFEDVADDIYRILHGRIWAGHNIRRFDNVRAREAFKRMGRTPLASLTPCPCFARPSAAAPGAWASRPWGIISGSAGNGTGPLRTRG